MSEEIIDINKIMEKENLKNSEYILCIFEVCLNKKNINYIIKIQLENFGKKLWYMKYIKIYLMLLKAKL